jgi:hypothetical protein
MSNEQWKNSEDIIEMLEALFDYHKFDVLKRVNELQLFYVECCKEHLYLLPQKEFKIALDYAINYLNKGVSADEVSEQNWYTEAAVFGMDYDEEMEQKSIYENISKKLNFSLTDSKKHAVTLAYFIDWVSLYSTSFNGQIPYQYSEFLNKEILRRIIREPFKE